MVGKGGGGRVGGGKAPLWRKEAHRLGSGGIWVGGQPAARHISARLRRSEGSLGDNLRAGNGGIWLFWAYAPRLMPGRTGARRGTFWVGGGGCMRGAPVCSSGGAEGCICGGG